MSLKDIIGDSEVCRQITALTNSRRLPHAVIIESRDQSQAKAVAKELAKISVCSSDGIRPCNLCSSCKKAQHDIHPDICCIEITDKKQFIGVGEIREMIADCYIKPNEAPEKVYVICDKMTAEAQNALLKILEEPPQNVRFIILCESSTAILKTVLSRSVLFKPGEENSVGSGELDAKAFEIAVEITEAIPKNTEMPLLVAAAKLGKDKVLAKKVFERMSEFTSLALEEKYLHKGGSPEYIAELARALRKKTLVSLIDVTFMAQTMLSQNCNMNLLATWYCAQIRQSRH